MKNAILKSEGLTKNFADTKNSKASPVLDNVSLEICRGDFTVIMGSSGAGKSTLLYCLSLMDSVTDGKVFYKNEDITHFSEKEKAALRRGEFGFAFQEPHLVSDLSIEENLLVAGYASKKYGAKEVRQKCQNLLQTIGLEKIRAHLPSQVSGGQAQRASLARAVINDPGILFADEPTGALNRSNADSVLDLLTSLNKNGQTILMVTHDIRTASRANRILYIRDGKIISHLELEPYEADEQKGQERLSQLTGWLEGLGW